MSQAAKLFYLMVEGQERGPFDLAQVRTMFETGLITPETMFKKAEKWQPLAEAISRDWQQSQPLARCFLRVSGQERGPFIFDQLRSMWQQGQITADTSYKLGELWEPLASALPVLAAA